MEKYGKARLSEENHPVLFSGGRRLLGEIKKLEAFLLGFSQPFIHIHLIPWQEVRLMNDFNLSSCL